MPKNAKATLTETYNIQQGSEMGYPPDGNFLTKQMRTIEIVSNKGKPLMVLQVENNKVEIEKILKNNGWIISSWKEEQLELVAIPLQPTAIHSSDSLGENKLQQMVVVNTNSTSSASVSQKKSQAVILARKKKEQKEAEGCARIGCAVIVIIILVIIIVNLVI